MQTYCSPPAQSANMEARGKYDFDATEEDELSFRKGDVIKVCVCVSEVKPQNQKPQKKTGVTAWNEGF